jgi:hypothetical protein
MKKGHGSKFGRKKEAAVAALFSEKNHAEAARVAGIDLKTLKRWMRMPEFIEEWLRARLEGMEHAYARAQQNSGACISVLLKLMVDSATPASGKIRAALGTFGIAQEGLNLEFETRLPALERAQEIAKSSGN